MPVLVLCTNIHTHIYYTYSMHTKYSYMIAVNCVKGRWYLILFLLLVKISEPAWLA